MDATSATGDAPSLAVEPVRLVDEGLDVVRSAAQWIVAAAAAVGSVLVGGLQLSSFGKIVGRTWLLLPAIAAFLLALWAVAWILRQAARVLVARRVTITDLLVLETAVQSRQQGLLGVDTLRDEKILKAALTQVHVNRGWLLPQAEPSVEELWSAYRRERATLDEGEGSRSDTELRQLRTRVKTLGDYVSLVSSFARMEFVRAQYKTLTDGLTGRIGWALASAVVAFAVLINWPQPAKDSRITAPTDMEITLTGSSDHLAAVGLPKACKAGMRLEGVGIDGTYDTPMVVTKASDTCPGSRFTVDKSVGLAVPVVR
jgi:hypothetical protein